VLNSSFAGIMKRIPLLSTAFIFLWFSTTAQDTLTLSRGQCEAIFLRENLSLIAGQLNIPMAEAEVKQASLWPNPQFTLDEINLWATRHQTGGKEVSPPIIGNWGRNQQYAVSLEQLIYTAGKRKKLMALQGVGVEKAQQYFNDLLRNLKLELRRQITELQYLQLSEKTFQTQLQSVNDLLSAYERQFEKGNIAATQVTRLQSKQFELQKELHELKQQNNETQKELKQLLHLPPQTFLKLSSEQFERALTDETIPTYQALVRKASTNRPDYQLALLEKSYFEKSYSYERALRTPDITVNGRYDRNGSTMLNFVGFGASIDLPLFNKNQGNIRKAELGIQQAKMLSQQVLHNVETEVAASYKSLLNAHAFQKGIDPKYLQRLDHSLDAHTRNFLSKNINMLEYLDFLESYQQNKLSILDAARDLNNAVEEVNYASGTELIP
jgi:cobalt-zinc-cadmium efflux system outer membrane protein